MRRRALDGHAEDNMRCPFCRNEDTKVIDHVSPTKGRRSGRRRSCQECGRRFPPSRARCSVVKRNGVTEPFSREKVMRGVRRGLPGRHVDEDSLALLAQQVEEAIRASGAAEIPSNEVGLAILRWAARPDEVVICASASVYRSFDSVEDFQREIDDLRAVSNTAASAEAG